MDSDVHAIRLEDYAWYPQPGPQTAAYCTKTWCTQLLYGGAKFGGKSDFLLGDFLQDVREYGQNWQGILVRQSLPELDDIIRRSFEFYPKTGAEWKEGKKNWQWPNGACLRLRYLETVKDFYRYNGHSFTWIGVDELGQWPDGDGFLMLANGCLRWASAEINVKRVRASANPMGEGHDWIKTYFEIDKYPHGMVPIWDDEAEIYKMFIPAKVVDNKLGLKRDPGYINRLRRAGSPALVKAWLSGDWTGDISGTYFGDCFTQEHVIRPFTIPREWLRFRVFDWGSSDPFVCQWWAVASNSGVIPKGALVCYRELYGASAPNKGLKLTNDLMAPLILSHEEPDEEITYSIADPSIFDNEGGPSIAEQMSAATNYKLVWERADNERVAGWQQVRNRLIGHPDHGPMIYWFDTCTDSIRTMPALKHDRKKKNDAATDGDDHCCDCVRYACQSRPWATVVEDAKEVPEFQAQQILDEVMNQNTGYQRL